MKLISNLAEIDRRTTLEFGISSLALMEHAGRAVADAALSRGILDPHILILCGPGNNGGDGLVCARFLWDAGYHRLQVVLLNSPKTPDAQENLKKLQGTRCPIAEKLEDEFIAQADIIVDALFGSGLNRPLGGLVGLWIHAIQDNPKRRQQWVLAIDIPSGIDSRTGQALGAAIQADATVTFGTSKPGLYLGQGKANSGGDIRIVDIGIPENLIQQDPSKIYLVDANQARSCLPRRDPLGHKYTMGHVLVIAGSKRMPGAAALCSEAALTAGAGVVTLATPESVFSQVQVRSELLRLPLPETSSGELSIKALEAVVPMLERCDAVLMGPGLGDVSDFFKAVLMKLKTLEIPIILDADALNALSKEKKLQLSQNFVVTPHLGEAKRLLKSEDDFSEDLLMTARQLQGLTNATVVLKAASMLSALPNGEYWINPTGNHGMATAGSGDVLAGIVAGLAAQAKHAQPAVLAGMYLHGLAGDLAKQSRSAYAVRAGDLIDYLPQAFLKLV